MTPVDYPQTRRLDLVETRFGQPVADPYRWLEADIRQDGDVAAWAEAQSEVTRTHLDRLPGRDLFRSRLTALIDREEFGAPCRRGTRYFSTKNPGSWNQPALFVREGVDGPDRVLIDPNGWSADNTVALAEWDVSDDGSRVAYAVQDGGTDWRTVRVIEVDTGKVLQDELRWVRFGILSWAKDGSGFFYSRFPEPAKGADLHGAVADHAIYFHALGTPQSADRLVHATPDRPQLLHVGGVSEDGRYLFVFSTPGASENALGVIDLTSPDWAVRTLVETPKSEWLVVANRGSELVVLTTEGAPRRKLVTVDLDKAGFEPVDLVPEDGDVLNGAWLLGGRLLTAYLVDARTEIRRHAPDGSLEGIVELPGIGAAGGFCGRQDDDEAFFVFTSFNAPTTIYRYDVGADARTVWARPASAADLDSIVVEQRFYASKDGTRVPMFIVRRRDVTGPAPTLLYGYGGFGISMPPYYSPERLAWVEQGGVFAVASIRGGGEYGRAWHDAGKRQNKQTSFDDFIAAAEYLLGEGIAAKDGLAIQGESNGGLLVGAVVNQRPDLFAAALAGVGVHDLLRFDKFTGGHFWIGDFGDPADEASFRNLAGLSPYHNVASGRDYPAILVSTAESDDRVVPGHSFKYVAALQAADLGDRPRLLRVETRAGHGAGKPRDKIIAETADLWSFAARWTGLRAGAVQ